MHIMITETSTSAEMVAIHLPVRGEVKGGNSDEAGDYIDDIGVVSLPVNFGVGLKKTNSNLEWE